MKARLVPFLLVMAVAAAGCATAYPGKSRLYPHIQSSDLPSAAYEHVVKSERPSDNSAKYRVYDVLIPLHDGSGMISEVKFFESKNPGKKKLIIVRSIDGSDTPEYISRKLAERLTYQNDYADFNVAFIREKGDFFEWDALAEARTAGELRTHLSKSAQRILWAVREVQAVLDWAETEPSVDMSRIGIAGFSLGCMVSTITMGFDWRISAGAFVMCGGDLPEILLYSEASFIKRVRKNAMERLGISRDELKKNAADIFSWVEPNVFAHHISPDRALLVDAKFDTFLPWWSRESLFQALRRPGYDPLRITLRYDHKMAFLTMTPLLGNYLDKKIAEFFREKLQ